MVKTYCPRNMNKNGVMITVPNGSKYLEVPFFFKEDAEGLHYTRAIPIAKAVSNVFKEMPNAKPEV